MRAEDLYNQRLTRILKAVALEKPDRTPVVLEYSGFAAYVTRTSMAEFLRSPKTNVDTMIQTFRLVGDGDAVNYGAFWPYGLCYGFMSKVRVPGVDLPDNEMWQVVETELMDRNDYDCILDLGWADRCAFRIFTARTQICRCALGMARSWHSCAEQRGHNNTY
jgi:hypothetical protein